MLGKVRGWLEAGQRPERLVVSAESPELKSYYSLYSSLVQHDILLYRRWQAPGRGSDILQLLVPRALRPDVLRLVHGSVGAGHFGNNKTLHRLRGKFHWPGCRHDVELHVHCCDSCTAQKGPSQCSRAPLQQHLVGAPMERVGVDILGPFPVTDSGNRYILVAMDYFNKLPEAFAIPDQSAATMAERLVEEMFTHFGAPAELHSDQGRNFEFQVLAEVCKRLGMTKTRTTPLHPQSDGLVGRFNRTLATQLGILASQHQRDWDRHLPLVLWAYRSAVQESSQLTPAALMFGRELRTPVDLVFGAPPEPEEPSHTWEEYYHWLRNRLLITHDFARKAQASAGFKQKRWYDTRCRGRAFAAGEQVWVYCPERKKGLSPKLRASWREPGEVVERLSEVDYRIRMPGRGRLVVLHQDRLAPYRPLATPDAAEPEVSSEDFGDFDMLQVQSAATQRSRARRRVSPPTHNQTGSVLANRALTQIKDHFTQLQIELVQLREMVLKQQPDRDSDLQIHSTEPNLHTTVSSTQTSPDAQTLATPSTPINADAPHNQESSPEPSTQRTHSNEKADIVLLIDSNGKFIEEKKLFPRHKVAKLWCPTTQTALELLSESQLGSPSHILIHTGTNNLRAEQERVATSLRAVIEKASHTFPSSKIVISTLLPRKDFHPLTINKINASISRDCALRPNVHLAHHPSLGMDPTGHTDTPPVLRDQQDTPQHQDTQHRQGDTPQHQDTQHRQGDTPQHQDTQHRQGDTPQHQDTEYRQGDTPQHQDTEYRQGDTPQHQDTQHRQGDTPQHQDTQHRQGDTPQHQDTQHRQGDTPQHQDTQHRQGDTPQHRAGPPSPDLSTLTQAIHHNQANRKSLDIFHRASTQPDQDQHCPSIPAAPPQQGPQPGAPSYAQVVSGAAGPATNQLRDIQQMLSLICSQLMVQRQW
ncbi:hypothetical protein SKAU_G00423750 [Synaphobranchus kaupii]|uniref:Gypsy retrotransposon integrase-like protein 1 n=1 Tax=Synaphobranchus kaupii TaxID=118154 RepID=A0A9Q1E5H2_SYNKA|nr:hypothetical protein SKAU_G00423750 [Synaphobranchus kaupii]